MANYDNDKPTERLESQIKAERKHETHRISHKIAANKKTNPNYAAKLQKYKDSKILTTLLHDAIMQAPENPNDYIPLKLLNKK